LDSPVARFGGRLFGEGEIADFHRGHIAVELSLDDAQQVGCFSGA
jgi:hypothetical protein